MKVEIERANLRFAKVMRFATSLSLITLLISSLLYFLDIAPLIEPDRVVETWHLPASEFWRVNTGKIPHITEYLDITHPDDVAIISIMIFAIVPLLSIISAFKEFKKMYRVIALLVIIELAFTIIRTYVFGVFGE